jgi:UDP-N-acetylglucosamine--N-acetylmuramyl-(pentapeptide) pyrophosphoryl-undecaprenol N-acetylglucosamine transferase
VIAITGGGTGGHLKIAKIIKDELVSRGIKPIYIGSTKGADKDWFYEDSSFSAKYFLNSQGVVDKRGIQKISSFIHILKLGIDAKNILKKHNIKAVFSVGGYSSAPASFAAILLNIPLFIHEQNAHIGTLNRLLKPFSKRFFNTFLYNDPYPIEEKFFKTKRLRDNLNSVIFLGGSQGAKAINDLALSVAKDLEKKGIFIIHQTGKRDYERVKNFYEKENIKADFFDFSKELELKMQKADLAISRAGASTLFELCANLLPSIFIPYPFAQGNHQYFNAKWVEEKGGAVVKRELAKDEFFRLIDSLDISKMSSNLAKLELKNGAKYIVDEILKTLEGK